MLLGERHRQRSTVLLLPGLLQLLLVSMLLLMLLLLLLGPGSMEHLVRVGGTLKRTFPRVP